MTTVLLNLHNAGLLPLSIVIAAMGIALGGLALGDFTGNHTITTIAGFEGIFCGLSAIYSAMGQILNAEYGKNIIFHK